MNLTRTAALAALALLLSTAVGGAWAQLSAKRKPPPLKTVTLSSVTVGPLYPGKEVIVPITARNPNADAIKLRRLTASLKAASNKAGCSGSSANLRITRQYSGPIVKVGAKKSLKIGTRANAVKVRMPNSVSNACQGATFTLLFKAEVDRA